MKSVLFTILALGSLSSFAGEWFATCSHEKNVTIMKKENGLFRVEINDLDGTPSADYYSDDYEDRKVLLSSDATLSLISSGVMTGCFHFTATKTDISMPSENLPLWNMYACYSQDKKDIVLFDGGDQFQPSSYVHTCSPGLMKRLKKEGL